MPQPTGSADLATRVVRCELQIEALQRSDSTISAKLDTHETRIGALERKIAWICGASAGIGAILGSGFFKLMG